MTYRNFAAGRLCRMTLAALLCLAAAGCTTTASSSSSAGGGGSGRSGVTVFGDIDAGVSRVR